MQSRIETAVARVMIAEDIEGGDTVEVGVENEDFTVKVKKGEKD